jgi:hypothetical protein
MINPMSAYNGSDAIVSGKDHSFMIDLTRDELKDLMRDILQELLWEAEQGLPDPDSGLEIRPEIAERLAAFKKDKPPTKSIDAILQELGLDLDE